MFLHRVIMSLGSRQRSNLCALVPFWHDTVASAAVRCSLTNVALVRSELLNHARDPAPRERYFAHLQ